MTLVGPQGSLSTTSIPEDNDYIETDIEIKTEPTTTDILEQEIVKDTFTNKNSTKSTFYPNDTTTLQGYVEGAPIVVTYYSKHSDTTLRTNAVDISFLTDEVHRSYTKINNFELRLQGGLDFSFNSDVNYSEFLGRGYTFPGIRPQMGDFFIYQIDNTFGLFKINEVTRLSLISNSYHTIEFSLFKFVSNEDINNIQTCVVENVFFDKRRFLSNEVSLLSTENYNKINEVIRLKRELIRHYFNSFFSSLNNILLRSDDKYDPYVVNFIIRILGFFDTNHIVISLVDVEDFKYSIYYRLLFNKKLGLQYLKSTCGDSNYLKSARDVRVNQLINRPYIKITPDANIEFEDEFVFSSNFYDSLIGNMTDMELLTYNYLVNGNIDVDMCFNLCNQYLFSNDKHDQFYHIPILIHLLNEIDTNLG